MNARCLAGLAAVGLGAAILIGGCSGDATRAEVAEVTEVDVPAAVESEEQTPAAPVAPTTLAENGWLLGVELPSTVESVIAQLGEPTETELPAADDPSPWGQWFRWEVEEGAYTFTVKSEYYMADRVAREAEVLYTELRTDGDVPENEIIEGLSLGHSSRADVEAAMGDSLQESNLANREEIDPDDRYADALVYEDAGLFRFFLFDEDQTLAGIALATFDIGNVD